MADLDWPPESAGTPAISAWHQARSNLCLDFHGDPLRAGLVVFSDGNHHMALGEILAGFLELRPDLQDIFYATTPPQVLVNALREGGVRLGNLVLSRPPNIFIGPATLLGELHTGGLLAAKPTPFARSCGQALLVRRDDGRGIRSAMDLQRAGVRLFLSNPLTEKASFQVYRETLENTLAGHAEVAGLLARDTTVYGERIHHREAPQALADDRADAALLYYHLALRFERIFPSLTWVPLAGSRAEPDFSGHPRTTYAAAPVTAGDPLADEFLEFLAGDEVREIYASHGLAAPV
ncbi:MAG: substrate-binding domain-containing protein [Gammaproteobacteria bacterium]|nr:substrate-binding domain-containing protein [Gammaproteobacteria bacterium]